MRRLALLAGSIVGAASCADARRPTLPPTATTPTAAIDAGPPLPTDLRPELASLAARRRAELDALVPEPPTSTVDHLAALSPCTRPTAVELATLRARVSAWIDRTAPTERQREDSIGTFAAGCTEPAGIVVDVQADLYDRRARDPFAAGVRRHGHWWTLRVGTTSIDVIADVRGTASVDFMEWSSIQTSETLVLADLDRDGAVEPLIVRDAHEGGGEANVTLSIGGVSGVRVVGHHPGSIELARRQPPSGDGVVVVKLAGNGPRRAIFRCVDDAPTWHACPASLLGERHDRALDATRVLNGGLPHGTPDRDLVDRLLSLLDVPADQRAALVARSPVAPVSVLGRRLLVDLVQTRWTRTADEQAASLTAAETTLAHRLREAHHETPCLAATEREHDRAFAAIERWITARERRPDALVLGRSCVGPRGAYWLATWRRTRGAWIERQAFFFVSARGTRVLLDTTVPLQDDVDGPSPAGDGMLDAKYSQAGESITALVASPGNTLTAVVDGVITGRRTGGNSASLVWTWRDRAVEVEMHADMLARTGPDPIIYWRATRAGVEIATTFAQPVLRRAPTASDPLGQILETSERLAEAELEVAYIQDDRLSNPDYRADILEALTLVGAPRELLARVRP